MDREAKDVDRGLEQFGVDAVPEERRSPIGLDQVPETVDVSAGFGSCASSSRVSDSRSGRIISLSKGCSR